MSGIRNPVVMASTNGGQRLTVSPSRMSKLLNICVGIALSQFGRPNDAAIGGGSFPSNSAGQRNSSVMDSLSLDMVSFLACSVAYGAVLAARLKACLAGSL